MHIVLLLLLSIIFAALVVFIGYQIMFMIPMLHGPVFVPSADDRLQAMLSLAKVPKKARLIDLGSGDGKVVLALAKKFPEAYIEGVEINPILVRRSRQKIKAAGLTKRVIISSQSFWDLDLSRYDVVYMYGTSYIMKKLELKVRQEMKPGTQFVSNYFKFPTLKPVKVLNEVNLYTF